MDISEKFRRVVRRIVGLPLDPGQPPRIDRLAWYRAQVTACASDGSTCDVQPEDQRISQENGVKVLVGVPGLVAVVQPGAVVMLGWERGDPARPRCMPIWEPGTTPTKVTLNATALELAGNAHPLPNWDTFLADFANLLTGLNTFTATGLLKVNLTAAITAMNTALAAGSYSSTKVKNG